MSKNKTLCIAEWQSFGKDEIKATIADMDDEKAQKIFDELKAFANQKGNFDDREGNHIFLTPYRNNQLKARNYVGLIQTKSGFCLEILPKTFRTANENEGFEKHQDKINEAKQILLDMLKTLKNSPFKQSHISNLKTQNAPLLEIFVIMFLNELETLIKKGLKSDYIECEQNRKFLKGKLLFTQNLKHNFAHKERFFTASDEFTSDIAPNKLIKSTLLLLSTRPFSTKTNARIMQSRFVFDEISPSQNYDKDFAKCENLRHFKAYELILLWCKIFLKKQTFTAYQGSQNAFALLFDMNELFESFVAWHLKKRLVNHIVKAQDGRKFLMQGDKFKIKPDLVIYDKTDTKLENPPKIIADTKWKILSVDEAKNFSISQSDLYQVFAYLARYQCNKGYLIYPKIDSDSIKHKRFTYKAKICFFDDYNPSGHIEHKKQQITLKIHLFNLKKYIK